jgi:ATP-dependent Clp protease ATP-binding subunit ClpC
MFERFTDRARLVIVLAQEEARLLDHNYIGTEHLLLGLSEGDGAAGQVLTGFGLVPNRVRQAVIQRLWRQAAPQSPEPDPGGEPSDAAEG